MNHFTPQGIDWVHHLPRGIWCNRTMPAFPGKRIPPSLKRHHLYHNGHVHSSDSARFNLDLSFFSSECTHTHARSLNPAPESEFPRWFLSLVDIALVFSVGVSFNNVCPSLWQSVLQRYYCQIPRSKWLSLHPFYFYFYPFLIPFFQDPFNSAITPWSSPALKVRRSWKVWEVAG